MKLELPVLDPQFPGRMCEGEIKRKASDSP